MTKNSSGKHVWTNYISVLLAAFVFVTGMMVNGNVEAAVDKAIKDLADTTARHAFESLLVDIYEQVDDINEVFKVEGCKKLKGIFKKDEYGDDNLDRVVGEVAPGQEIRAHFLYKVYPLDVVNQKRQEKKFNPVEYYNRSCTINLTAMNGNKTVKKVSKSYKNTVDNFIDYKVEEGVTQLEIKIHTRLVGQVKKHKNASVDSDDNLIVLTVNNKLKPFPISTTKKMDNKDEQVAEESGDDSGGINFFYLGGGFVLIMMGGYSWLHFIGGSAGGAPGSMPEPPEPEPPAPPEPDYFLYKDPAGFETLYMKDPETGNWYNYQDYEEGYRVPVDMDKLQEYDAQRQKDVKWNQDQMQKLENRETGLDKELKQEYQDMLAREKQIQQETKQDLLGLKTNTYGLSQEERKRVMEERQANDQKDVDKWTKRADAWDTAMTVAEGVQTAADIGVDIMATVAAPVGGGYVADAYALTKNVAGCGMEGLVNKERTLVGGLAEGLTKGLIDAGQNHSTAKWQKYLSYVGGESIKGGIDAGLKGESILKGAVKGALQGGTKLGVDAVGKKIGDKITKNSADSLKHAYEHAGDIRNRIAPQVSERSVKALQEMNLQKHLANMHKGEHQTLANTITQGITRNLLPKIFG